MVANNLMAVLEVCVLIRIDLLEIRVEDKELIAGGDIDAVVVEGDTTKAAVPASSLPVNGIKNKRPPLKIKW